MQRRFGYLVMLRVGPPNTLLAKLLAQCVILGLEILDHVLLVTVDLTSKSEKEKQ